MEPKQLFGLLVILFIIAVFFLRGGYRKNVVNNGVNNNANPGNTNVNPGNSIGGGTNTGDNVGFDLGPEYIIVLTSSPELGIGPDGRLSMILQKFRIIDHVLYKSDDLGLCYYPPQSAYESFPRFENCDNTSLGSFRWNINGPFTGMITRENDAYNKLTAMRVVGNLPEQGNEIRLDNFDSDMFLEPDLQQTWTVAAIL